MIDTSRAGPGELSCVTEDENGDQSSTPKLGSKIISTDPGNVTVEVSGLEPGKCKLTLKWGCHEIPPMPLDVTVYDPSQCSCKLEGITTSKVKTGDRVCVLIDTTKVGGCKPMIKARGPSTAEYHVELEKIGEGEYRATFIPNEDGHQNVEVFIDDVMVPNCPLTFKTYTPISDIQPGSEDSHREISSPPTTAETDSGLLNRTNEHHDDASVTFAVGVETNDTDTSQLHLETVKPKKRYRVRVKEEKPGEWKTTCSAEDKGEQELRVLRNESELIGQPIKISVRDQKKAGGLNYCKIVLVALLVLLMISVIVTLSLISITDPEIRPY
jgi:hypothetical protein